MTKDKPLMQRNDLPSRQADRTPTDDSTVKRINDLEETILLDTLNTPALTWSSRSYYFQKNGMYEDKLSY